MIKAADRMKENKREAKIPRESEAKSRTYEEITIENNMELFFRFEYTIIISRQNRQNIT
jgi:hypothetical protein